MGLRHPIIRSVLLRPRPTAMIIGSLLVSVALSCAPDSGPRQETGAIVATIGDRKITEEELTERVRGELIEIDSARYDVLKVGLEELIDEVLLEEAAQSRNLTTNELLELEVEDKVEALNTSDPIDSKDVERFYNQYKGQLDGQPIEQLRPAIEQHLQGQRVEELRSEFLKGLREKADIVVRLRPPTVKVSEEGPSRGPLDAEITLLEFSDFECPFCRNAAATVERVMEHYEGKIRLVFRHLPLPIHANARRAAEASACAGEAGKFWPYHDLLFRNQNALTEDDLTKYAREAGIDEATFVSCLQSGRATAVVEKDTADAEAAGVNGTPSFFINGRPLSGAQPYDAFKKAIDEELARRNQ